MISPTPRARIAFAAAAVSALCVFSALVLAAPASAAPSLKKAIWGPVEIEGQSQFPIYSDLGAGIYEYAISWRQVAPSRPADPSNPSDPAYVWPSELDLAISEAQRYGMKVSVLLLYSPPWANGGKAEQYPPNNVQDFATFASAASKRYPGVNLWMVWGEPSIGTHWTPSSKRGTPRRYAQMLDSSYAALKRVDGQDLVVGGNTITQGDIKPLDFIRNMKLPNGRPPRMDLYGHNPFSPRKPNLKRQPVKAGTADTSDLDTLVDWIDEHLAEKKRNRGLKVFVSEWTIPTDHSSPLFGFYGDRQTVANYLTRALKIARSMKRVYSLGWFYLYDQQPNALGDQLNWGLITHDFIKKPAYYAFKAG